MKRNLQQRDKNDARIDRRVLLRTLAYGLGAATLGRVALACTAPVSPSGEGSSSKNRNDNGANDETSPAPTDQDEHVPGKSEPVDTGSDAPKVPVQSWEARVKQLESEQKRVWNRGVFERGDAGPMTGKENSHVPKAAIVFDKGTQYVEVVVEHVMGTNTIGDAGKPDAMTMILDASKPDSASDAGLDASKADAAPAPPPVVHYITTIYLRGVVDGKDVVVGLWEFSSTDAAPPTVRFVIPAGVKSVVAHEWCTLHGLWRAAPLDVP